MANVISMADFKTAQGEKGPFDERLRGRILRMLNRSVELRTSTPHLGTVEAREDAIIASSSLRIEAGRLAQKAGICIIEQDGSFRLEASPTGKE